MGKNYNLNEMAGDDTFTFVIDDHHYTMSYPSSRDILDIQASSTTTEKLSNDIEKLGEEMLSADAESQKPLQEKHKELSDKLALAQTSFIDWTMKFVTPVGEAPNAKDLIMSKSMKFLSAFIRMVQEELKG